MDGILAQYRSIWYSDPIFWRYAAILLSPTYADSRLKVSYNRSSICSSNDNFLRPLPLRHTIPPTPLSIKSPATLSFAMTPPPTRLLHAIGLHLDSGEATQNSGLSSKPKKAYRAASSLISSSQSPSLLPCAQPTERRDPKLKHLVISSSPPRCEGPSICAAPENAPSLLPAINRTTCPDGPSPPRQDWSYHAKRNVIQGAVYRTAPIHRATLPRAERMGYGESAIIVTIVDGASATSCLPRALLHWVFPVFSLDRRRTPWQTAHHWTQRDSQFQTNGVYERPWSMLRGKGVGSRHKRTTSSDLRSPRT